MKLVNYKESLEEKMSEFDIWVTPSLGETRDMPQFSANLESMKHGFDIMTDLTSNFNSLENCTASYISHNAISRTETLNDDKIIENLNAIYGVLLLVTGKTDNNINYTVILLKTKKEIGVKKIYHELSNRKQ